MIDVKDNFLGNDQLNHIWKEINMIKPLMIQNSITGEAINKKKGYGRLFNSFMAQNIIPFIFNLNHVEDTSILINYFEDGGYYKPHLDECEITSILMLSLDNNFIGGDLHFPDSKVTYQFKHNRFITFHKELHEVTPIKFINNSNGRYSINYFMKGDRN